MDPAQFWSLEMQNQQNQQAQAQQNTQNMMGAIGDIAGAYMKSEEQKAKGRAFKNTFNVLAPALNMTTDKLAQVVGTESLKNDNDWYYASEAFMPILPSLINLQLSSDRLGIQQQGQQLQRDLPGIKAGTDAEADVAAGKAPYRPANRPRGVIPGAGAAVTPMPVVSQNPDVFQQVKMPFAGMGGNR